MSRLVEEKALDVLLDALAIIDKRGIQFEVRIAGDGNKRKELEEQINRLGLNNKVNMLGWVKDTDKFYNDIDIFCFPSRHEEFGLVLLEAYKNGLPAVVTNSDGPSDIVRDKINGLIVPKDNAEALAEALESLLLDKKKADVLAKGGYNTLINEYSIPVFGKNLSEALHLVIEAYKGKKTS